MELSSTNHLANRARGKVTPLRLVLPSGNQFRSSVPLFDRPLLTVVMLYLALLVIATIWLAVRMSGMLGFHPTPRLAGGILSDLRGGSNYYLLVGIVLVGNVLLFITARSWSGRMQERSGLASRPLDAGWRQGGEPGRTERPRPSELPRRIGRHRSPPSLRHHWEEPLAVSGGILVMMLSVILLALTVPIRESAFHLVLWAYAAAGATFGGWAAFREYRRISGTTSDPSGSGEASAGP